MTGPSPDQRVRSGVRRAVATDAGELLTLQYAAWVIEAIANDTLAIPPLHETLADVAGQIADRQWRIWMLREHGRLLATVRTRSLRTDTAYLGRLAVVPDLRGEGLGSAMLRWAEADLSDDVRRIELVTGLYSTDNHAFYARHGYLAEADDPIAGTRLMRKRR